MSAIVANSDKGLGCNSHAVASDCQQAPGMDAGGLAQVRGDVKTILGVLPMSLKPYLVTFGVSVLAIVFYKKFLGGRFGFPA